MKKQAWCQQYMTMELKDICESEYVLEVTGDYTGTLTGRGASHEPKEHHD